MLYAFMTPNYFSNVMGYNIMYGKNLLKQNQQFVTELEMHIIGGGGNSLQNSRKSCWAWLKLTSISETTCVSIIRVLIC